jgi:hypothetical protein
VHKTSKAKGVGGLSIVDQREKWEIKAAKKAARKQSQDKIP